jgi:hypothetical protein
MKRLWPAIVIFCLLALPGTAGAQSFINWQSLRNPVLSYPHWSIKDVAMAHRQGTFYVFFSAFYEDHGVVRSHVVEVSTRDFKTYSKPIFNFDGEEDGWIGMCSPDVQWMGNEYELSFNSWGDKPGKPNQLFYMTSTDLLHWSRRFSLAANLTAGKRAIDAAIAHANGGYYLIWKAGTKVRKARLAFSKALSGLWNFVGSGYPSLTMPNGRENGLVHENFEYVHFDGKWHLLTSDYPHGHHEYLYTLESNRDWLHWGKGLQLKIPAQDFNKFVHADAAALYDWRKQDGYFYLIYAGRNEKITFLGRGWNRLALARSKGLVHWIPAGASR